MTNEFTSYWNTAQQYLTGGVCSSFRINPFTGQPMYLNRADGAYIYRIDGRRYVDFFMGHGASPLGHNRAEIIGALRQALDYGFFAEYDHPLTLELAKKIGAHIPCAERVRFVNSGSEATLLAIRLARGLRGVQLITSDDHAGLRAARRADRV